MSIYYNTKGERKGKDVSLDILITLHYITRVHEQNKFLLYILTNIWT